MDSLFDQLKSAPAVNLKKSDESPSPKKVETGKSNVNKRAPSPPLTKKDVAAPDKIKKKKVESSTMRRDSMPPPASTFVTKVNKAKKSRSLSPAKDNLVKQFKVLLERKKFDDISSDNKSSHKSHSKTTTTTTKAITSHKRWSQDERNSASTSSLKNGEKTPKKATPTKAQQKLFDPDVLVKAQRLKQLKVKCCKVRIKRQNLKKLQREFHAKKLKQGANKKKLNNSKKSPSPTKPQYKKKNQRDDSYSPSPSPPKRGRPRQDAQGSGFFIKIADLTKSPKTLQKGPKSKLDKKKATHKLSIGSIAKRVNAAAAISSTKPTKFTRTQLIKMYGKRVFCSRVKIERCAHPMMMIFESNARARRLQAKQRSKSKNLSVSFREQVEIFGDSSSDSEEVDTSQMSMRDIATTSTQAAALKPTATPTILSITATPARLKKVENGKVVDDIELDPSLFVAPTIASTPYPTAGRKKRDRKSFSPLKGDGAPSPRKEQLKLANEKMPPSSLRRLSAEEEEDDEDDECEYIVPIDIPDRRTSRTSSANANDEDEATAEPEAESTRMNITDISAANSSSVNNSSADTFASAVEEPVEKGASEPEKSDENNVLAENITKNGSALTDNVINDDKSKEEAAGQSVLVTDQEQDQEHDQDADKTDNISVTTEKLPKLTRINSESPAPSYNSLNDLVDTLIKNVDDDVPATADDADTPSGDDAIKALDDVVAVENFNNGDTGDHNADNDVNMAEQIMPSYEAKSVDDLTDNISLQMFVDDDVNSAVNSQFLEDAALKDSEIVDGIVKERIDEISSKDKQLDSTTNEATTQNNLLSSNVTAE